MGLGARFGPGVIGTPLGVVGGLLDELVGALAKPAKGAKGDGLRRRSVEIPLVVMTC